MLLGIAAVVREVVVAVGDVDRGVVAVAPLVGKHERADAGDVALERQRDQVEHEPDVLAEVVGNSLRTSHAGRGQASGRGLGSADPLLDLTDGRQVLVDLAAIVQAHAGAKLPGVVGDEVEDALLVELALGALGRRALAGPAT